MQVHMETRTEQIYINDDYERSGKPCLANPAWLYYERELTTRVGTLDLKGPTDP